LQLPLPSPRFSVCLFYRMAIPGRIDNALFLRILSAPAATVVPAAATSPAIAPDHARRRHHGTANDVIRVSSCKYSKSCLLSLKDPSGIAAVPPRRRRTAPGTTAGRRGRKHAPRRNNAGFLSFRHVNCFNPRQATFLSNRLPAAAIFVEKILTTPARGVRVPVKINGKGGCPAGRKQKR